MLVGLLNIGSEANNVTSSPLYTLRSASEVSGAWSSKEFESLLEHATDSSKHTAGIKCENFIQVK
jgi:hypothetical protein